MGLLNLIGLTLKVTAYFAVAILLVAFLPGIPPNVEVKVIEYSVPRELQGPLAPNNILDNSELILDQIRRAESVAVDGGTIYFGSHGGIVYKYDGTLTKIAQTGRPCDLNLETIPCGIPLGIRLDHNKQLVLADAAEGILGINPETGKKVSIVKLGTIVEGLPVTLTNDLDVAKDGTIYFSDAMQYPFKDILIGLSSGDPKGRLIKTDPKTGRSTVLIENIMGANGIQLSPKEDFVLVSELQQHRVLRYHLQGEKKGTWDVFVDRLPGSPDNIRSNGKGGYYIALALSRDEATEKLGKYPLVRRLIMRMYFIVQCLTKALQYVYPQNYEELIHSWVFSSLPAGKTIIVEVDNKGQIIGSLQNDKLPVRMISQATLGNQYLYMGSPHLSGIYRLKRSMLQK